MNRLVKDYMQKNREKSQSYTHFPGSVRNRWAAAPREPAAAGG